MEPNLRLILCSFLQEGVRGLTCSSTVNE